MIKGKTALVTGSGGKGMGRAIALTLAQQGLNIIVNDINEHHAQETLEEVRQLGCDGMVSTADITRFDQVQQMVQQAKERFGTVDILVNSAGVWSTEKFIDLDVNEWEKDIRVNYYGVLHCIKAVLPDMVSQEYGNIVSIISDAGRVGEANASVYSGAKAAVMGFSKALAKEVGRYQVRVNCVAMATTRTPQTREFLQDFEDKILKSYPLRRLGEPQDAANAVSFFISEEANWITGQVLSVNGGYSMVD